MKTEPELPHTLVSAPLVSIGIPTRNRASSYLLQALASALAQTYTDVEIIVSDNASSDATPELLRAIKSPRLRYFSQEHALSANDNFNFCLQKASGDYFLLLHDDDLIDPDFVRCCVETAEYRNDVGIIRTGTRVIDGNGSLLGESRNNPNTDDIGDFFLSLFRHETSFYFCNTLYNTELLRALGGFGTPHNLLQDVLAIVNLAALHGQRNVRDPKASFRRHGSNMGSHSSINAWCEDSIFILERMCDLSPAKAHEIRQEGLVFMTKQNYSRLARSGAKSLRSFWAIYHTFDRAYPPHRYAFGRLRRHARKAIREILKPGHGGNNAS